MAWAIAPPPTDIETGTPSDGPYGISLEQLSKLSADKDMAGLKALGGQAGLAASLRADLTSGLDSRASDLRALDLRRATFGANVLPKPPPKSFLWLCWQALQDPIILLLVAAALVSTVLGAAIASERAEKVWVEGVAIWIAVAVVTCVGAGNDWQKDRQFRQLSAETDIVMVKVVRDRLQTAVLTQEMLVGDVIILEGGDRVLCDGILFHSEGIILDEAALTGESEPIKKSVADDPWIRSGTQVTEGSGRMLVVAVGLSSEWGKTMVLVSEAGDEQTPLQAKLEWVAVTIGKVGISVAVACFVALLIKWCVKFRGFPWKEINNDGPVQFFLYAVTIIVVAIPEGLPLAVTISLAYSMSKMYQDHNFVRVLSACETMGGATAICSDKTGTLTENRMTVVEGWFGGVQLSRRPTKDDLLPGLRDTLCKIIAQSSTAFFIGGDFKAPSGNRTDCALLSLVNDLGVDFNDVRAELLGVKHKLFGFTSSRKMASAVVYGPNGGVRVLNKGAAEWVLRKCTRVMGANGLVVPMADDVRRELESRVTAMATRGLRCIALSYVDVGDDQARSLPEAHYEDVANVEQDLTLLAVVGIKDPVRVEVPHAMEVCHDAGILVRMVTGDNIHTAKHIARECGIFMEEEGHVALEGPVFRDMPEDELVELLPRLRVLARSSPEDKLTLVRLLKKQGEVVAVTGDGTNDAPALKESDVGLAMGSGTDVAKQAADIIILNDSFRSIVQSVLWGRSVFNNIRKFLQFQLTVNFVALVTAFVGALAGGHQPLTVLQLLWVNLIMDTMGALALATEPPTADLLLQKPNDRNTRLVNGTMWKHIFAQGFYQLFWMFFFLFALPKVGIARYDVHHDDDQSRGLSLLFNAFIMMQVANEVNSRRIADEYDIFSGLIKNPIFICVIVVTLGLQAIIMEFLGFFFKVDPLDWEEWFVTIAIGLGAFPVSYLTRFLTRLFKGPTSICAAAVSPGYVKSSGKSESESQKLTAKPLLLKQYTSTYGHLLKR